MDRRKEHMRGYHNLPHVKKRRRDNDNRKIREQRSRIAKDVAKGLDYQTGSSGPKVDFDTAAPASVSATSSSVASSVGAECVGVFAKPPAHVEDVAKEISASGSQGEGRKFYVRIYWDTGFL